MAKKKKKVIFVPPAVNILDSRSVYSLTQEIKPEKSELLSVERNKWWYCAGNGEITLTPKKYPGTH